MGNLNFQDVIRDVHDASLHSLKTTASLSASTVYVGNSTLYAVVNTGSASDSTVKLGFVTAAISTPTLFAVVNTGEANTGNSTINPGPNQIGSVTVSNPITLNSVVTLSSSTNYIGLASVNIGGTLPALVASTVNIGSVSVLGGGIALNAGVNNIGFATIANAVSWPDPKTFIGLATTVNGAGTQFIGLVTAWTRNAGTTKTLINLPVGFSVASITTIAVPTNVNSVYVTNLLLNSNATVRITLKSGVTYLTGNASIGVTLNPGGGLVMTGSPDSPSWIGLPSGALVVEKFDLTATSAQIAGNIVYYQE